MNGEKRIWQWLAQGFAYVAIVVLGYLFQQMNKEMEKHQIRIDAMREIIYELRESKSIQAREIQYLRENLDNFKNSILDWQRDARGYPPAIGRNRKEQ